MKQAQHLTFYAIGTQWDIHFSKELHASQTASLKKQLQARAEAFDSRYSRFRCDSLIAKLAQKAGTYNMPDDGLQLLRFYKRLYDATDGLVTPLIGQILSDAGYDAQYSFQPRQLTIPPTWDDVITFDATMLTMKRPALLDFGAAGKGYLVDILYKLLKQADVGDFTINASGDIRHSSAANEAITVGLQNPRNVSEVIGTVTVANQSLCASASNKRAWGALHHIMNPQTLKPVTRILATWTIADDTLTADGMATALFFTDPKQLAASFRFAYAIMYDDMSFVHSNNFPITTFEEQHE